MKRRIINILAALGVLGLILTGAAYFQGWRATQRFDPKATQVMADFARRAIESNVASASVVKMPLADGVSAKQAAAAMIQRATQRNIELLNRLAFDKEVRARTGKPYPYVEIFQFCDPLTAAALLEYNQDFVAFMPCHIAMYEDPAGKYWLITMNLDLLIHGGPELDPELKSRVLALKEGILDIMAAGAAGSP